VRCQGKQFGAFLLHLRCNLLRQPSRQDHYQKDYETEYVRGVSR